MHKKKEIFFIIIIFITTLVLVLLPIFLNNKGEVIEDNPKTTKSEIKIKVEGEINHFKDLFDDTSVTNEITLFMPIGVSMGDITRAIDMCYTKYSIRPKDYQTRYYKDTTIVISSSYIEEIKEVVDQTGKININLATAKELKKLYGIGDVRADIIIEYRTTKKIESYSELKSILGVSDEIIEIIKESSVL